MCAYKVSQIGIVGNNWLQKLNRQKLEKKIKNFKNCSSFFCTIIFEFKKAEEAHESFKTCFPISKIKFSEPNYSFFI